MEEKKVVFQRSKPTYHENLDVAFLKNRHESLRHFQMKKKGKEITIEKEVARAE